MTPAPASYTENPSPPLAGRVAVVTGASRGLGAAIASGLAADGARTVIWYRADTSGARSVVNAIKQAGGDATSYQVDVTVRAEVEQAVSYLVTDHGRIDILVNNAGIMRRAPFLNITDNDWREVLGTNLSAYFVVSQVVARVMVQQKEGSIVQVSSTNDQIADTECTAYATAKGGVAMLTKQMALELGRFGVRTNAVSPGMVETDLNREELSVSTFRKSALERIPLMHFARPEDIANAVRFLASDHARSINGATLRVDGGRTVV